MLLSVGSKNKRKRKKKQKKNSRGRSPSVRGNRRGHEKGGGSWVLLSSTPAPCHTHTHAKREAREAPTRLSVTGRRPPAVPHPSHDQTRAKQRERVRKWERSSEWARWCGQTPITSGRGPAGVGKDRRLVPSDQWEPQEVRVRKLGFLGFEPGLDRVWPWWVRASGVRIPHRIQPLLRVLAFETRWVSSSC